MKAKILTLIVAGIELLTIKLWLICTDFRSMMDMSSVNIKLQLEDYIHNDTGSSMLLIRFFHNKLTGLVVNMLDKYLKYWDIRFISNIFSLVGVFGMVAGIWYLLHANIAKKYKIFFFCILIVWPIPYVLHGISLTFTYKIFIFYFPYFILSLFGIWSYLRSNNRYAYIVVILLSFISVWWFLLLPREISYFCTQ